MTKITATEILNRINYGSAQQNFWDYEVEGDFLLNLNQELNLSFSRTKFLNNVNISSNSHIVLTFEDAEFSQAVNFHFIRGILNCKGAKFFAGLNLKVKDNMRLEFSNSKFQKTVNICDSKLDSVNFSEAEFIYPSNEDTFLFERNIIKGGAIFSNSKLNNAKFNKSNFDRIANFDNAQLNYSVIPGDGNFIDIVFERDAYFNGVNFEKGAFFNGSSFKGTAIFVGVNRNMKCAGDFSGSNFKKRCFFDNSYFEGLIFRNCEFEDVASFRYFFANELEISKATFLKGSDFLNSEILKADKETFRIIKNEFLKVNNQIEALHYRSKEMKSYEKELEGKGFSGERFLLWINRISNEYGLNWWRGVKFTIGASILFYFIYLLTLHELPFNWGWVSWESFWNASGDTIKYFFKFFLPTHYFDFMNGFGPSALSFFVDFLGRIAIGYGIYQTIQAFRKFGKD